jgi:hypothetical protein
MEIAYIMCVVSWLLLGCVAQDFIGNKDDSTEMMVGRFLFWPVYLAIGVVIAVIIILILATRFCGKVIREALKELATMIKFGYNEIKDCF